jgi:asparagine synthase (glutamine-hydrolysing)
MSAKNIYLDILRVFVSKNREVEFKFTPWLRKEWVDKYKGSEAITYKGYRNIDNIKDLSLLSIKEISIPYQLHSEDRNAMLFSIESRVPFLDHELVEAMMGLPEDVYYNYGLDKNPIREGLKDILPEKIYNRKTKLGFASSDDIWMRKNSKEIKSKLEAAVNYFREILDPQVLTEFDKYSEGKSGYNSIFFRILSLHAWAKATQVSVN